MTVAVTAQKVVSVVSGSAARLRAIWEPLRKFLAFSLADESIAPARNVTVSISKRNMSVAYGTRVLSRIRIKGTKSYPLEDRFPTPEGLASSVSMALNNLRAPKANVSLCIPKSWAVIKSVEFPCTVRDNLPDVISYEMDRLTPFSREEALYDFRILNENAGRLSVLLVAAKVDLVKPYIEALGERGLNVTKVTINLSGLGTFSLFAHKTTEAVLFQLSDNEYEAALYSGGLIVAARSGGLGSGDEESQAGVITGEIERLVEEGGRRGMSPRVMLSIKGMRPSLIEILKSRIIAPFKILEEAGGSFRLPSGEIPYESVGGVLESLWPKAKGVNLLAKGVREKAKTPVAFSMILVSAMIIIWIVSILIPVDIEQKRLAAIQSEIAARKDEIKKVEALKKEIDALEKEVSIVGDFKNSRPMALDLLKELTHVLPKNTWLSRMRITETTTEIEGYAASATELLPKLEASKYFRKVEFASPTFRDVRMNLERFNIKMEIEGAKKIEAVKKEEVKPEEGKKTGAGPVPPPAPGPAKRGGPRK